LTEFSAFMSTVRRRSFGDDNAILKKPWAASGDADMKGNVCATRRQSPKERFPVEMLKMKQPPGMCMKTQVKMTKCPAQYKVFTRKYSNRTIFDNHRSGLLAEIA